MLRFILPATNRRDAIQRNFALRRILRGNQELRQVFRFRRFAAHPHQPGVAGNFDFAGGRIAIGFPELIGDIDRCYPVSRHGLWVDLNLQFRFVKAECPDTIYTGNSFQLVFDQLRLTAQIFIVRLTGDHDHCGGEPIRRCNFHDRWVFDVFGQFIVRLTLYLPSKIGNTFIKLPVRKLAKAHQDVGEILSRGTTGKFDIPHIAKCIFQRTSHQLFYVCSGSAWQDGENADEIEIDFGILLARHLLVGHQAHEHHDREQNVDQRMVGQQCANKIHSRTIASSSPSCKRVCPRITISVSSGRFRAAGRPSWADAISMNSALLFCAIKTPNAEPR